MTIVRWILGVVVGLVVAATLASFVFNLVTSDPNVPVTRLWHGRFVRADGVLTAYRTWDSPTQGAQGRPIVLLGGFVEPSFVWAGVGPLLAAGHRVYALDLDGFGYTERRGPWTLQAWGDQVQAFMSHLGIRRPIVVGHSLGAAVAVELARRHLTSRIVLLDGDALKVGGPPGWAKTILLHSPFFTTAFRLATRIDWVVRKVLANAWGPNHPPLDAASVNRWTDQFRAKGARGALRGMLQHGIAGFTRQELRDTHTSALVVWGADDSVDDPSAGRATARDLHARFVLVPGAGHLSMLSRPAAVARAIATG